MRRRHHLRARPGAWSDAETKGVPRPPRSRSPKRKVRKPTSTVGERGVEKDSPTLCVGERGVSISNGKQAAI